MCVDYLRKICYLVCRQIRQTEPFHLGPNPASPSMPRSAIGSVDGDGAYDDRADRVARYCVIEGNLYPSDDETINQSVVSTAQQSSSSHNSQSSDSIAFDGGIAKQDHSEAVPSSSRRRRFCFDDTGDDLLASDDDDIDDCSQYADLGTAITLSRLEVSP